MNHIKKNNIYQYRVLDRYFQSIRTLLLLLFLSATLIVQAQQKMLVKGVVTDKSTKEPIPFCNIYLSDLKTVTISQIDGMFSIQLSKVPDTISFTIIGYEPFRLPIINKKENIFEIELTPNPVELNEVVINPSENPANVILKKVIGNKERNNPLRFKTIACNAYTKVLANSVGESNNKLLLKNGLPIFFDEKYTQNYLSNDPFIEKERVIDEKLTGLGLFNELNVFGINNSTHIEFNFYDGVVEVFDKPFITPLNNRALMYYRFYLIDSLTTEFGKEYLIEFKPRNMNDLVFNGYMKVIEGNWALSELSAKVPIAANLNYINKMEVFQTFTPVNDSMMFFHINEVITEFKITKDSSLINIDFSGIFDKRTIFSNVKVNFQPLETDKGEKIWKNDSIFVQEPINKNLLELVRPEEISVREEKAIHSIDSLNNNWKVKTTDGLTRMFLTGYIPGKYFDLGPYLDLLKYNKVEGYRITLSGRTSANLTKNMMLFGHVGYGFYDRELKYGIGAMYKFNNYFRRIATFEYRNDMSVIGYNRSIFLIKENMMVSGSDNVIAVLFNGKPIDQLSREISYRAEYEHEWRRGFINLVSLNHRTINPGLYRPFIQNSIPAGPIYTDEITFGARFSWQESITDNYCRRYYMTTKYPIVNLRITGGHFRIGALSENYLLSRIVVNHDLNIGQTKFEYILEGGFSLGKLPFPLLELQRTNQSMSYSLYYFNMMKATEYASDRFVSLMAQYHLNGLLFNRVPLLKKIGIREVFSAKVLWSHLDQKHSDVLQFPSQLKDANSPYTEVSAGIENIFQYFRVDLIARISEQDLGETVPLAVRFRFDFNF